mgnify:CR=1 FL=1
MDIEEAENRLFQLKQSMELLDLVTGKPIEENTKLNIKAIETVLSELEKKDKIIDLMAEQLAGLAIFDIEKDEPLILGDKEEVREYFTNKVEREGK